MSIARTAQVAPLLPQSCFCAAQTVRYEWRTHPNWTQHPMRFEIRETGSGHGAAVMALYPLAFPNEDLRQLVQDLLAEPVGIRSLEAFDADQLVGHALYSLGTVDGIAGAALLGPLAVRPSHQRMGVGTGLQSWAHKRLSAEGARQVFVLGDPKYYGRLGFAREDKVTTPCPIPSDWVSAWQSLPISPGLRFGPGQLELPDPWMDPTYWTP